MPEKEPLDMENADGLLIENGQGRKKKGNRILYVLIGLIILFFAAVTIWLNLSKHELKVEKVDAGKVAEKTATVKNEGSRTDSEVYRRANREREFARAEEVGRREGSMVPRLIEDGEDPLPEAPKVEPVKPAPVRPEPVKAEPAPAPPRIVEYTPPATGSGGFNPGRWLKDADAYTPGSIETTRVMRREKAGSAERETFQATRNVSGGNGNAKEDFPPLQVTPGDILYAVMEIGANSDQPGTPVVARVASGKWTGAKFIGGFRRMDERMVLIFNRAVVKDAKGRPTIYSVTGYAVDPDTFYPGVASKVDTHFLERWGGLIASSFLEGFGEAKSRSGSRYYYGNDNNPGQFINDYDLSTELWIAGGKVGEKASEKFAANFNREPTVTLEPGLAIGILLM